MATTVEYVPDLTGGGGGGGGNGFQNGAVVANSTGNTPADGFTLSNGSTDTNTESPNEITLSSTSNPGVIDLNSETGPTLTIGNQATIGASTVKSIISTATIETGNSGTGTNVTISAGGTATVMDASGSSGELGSPNGAGLTLTGAG